MAGNNWERGVTHLPLVAMRWVKVSHTHLEAMLPLSPCHTSDVLAGGTGRQWRVHRDLAAPSLKKSKTTVCPWPAAETRARLGLCDGYLIPLRILTV